MISGDIGQGTGVFSITSDLTFNVTAASSNAPLLLIFSGWASSLTNDDDFATTTMISAAEGIPYSINGVSQVTTPALFFDGGAKTADIAPQDAYVLLDNEVTLAVNDVIRVGRVDIELPESADWRSEVSGVFSGDLFLTDNFGNRFSDVATVSGGPGSPQMPVPVPATIALFGLGLLGFAVLRRRTVTRAVFEMSRRPVLSITGMPGLAALVEAATITLACQSIA